jgi:hypothetical protein
MRIPLRATLELAVVIAAACGDAGISLDAQTTHMWRWLALGMKSSAHRVGVRRS